MSHRASRTLAIVKPDAFRGGKVGRILAHLEDEDFRILGARVVQLTDRQARAFYTVHQGKPFFSSLVQFMTSGPSMVLALERPDAVAHLRDVIGATDPEDAADGTIRSLYAESKERNAIHASDSPENAKEEIAFFFARAELL